MTHTPSAKIYAPYKTATQSGTAKTKKWVLEFDATDAPLHISLLGWNGTDNTLAHKKISFPTREQAETFANSHGISYSLIEPPSEKRTPKSYAANFIGRLSYL